MYCPPAFAENRAETLGALMTACPLAMLITAGDDGPEANLVPMLWEAAAGVLRAHLARANPQLAALARMQADGAEALAVFQGPQAYVSPSWYPSKAEHDRVVPTWNYLMVQLRGIPRVIDDPAWLRTQIEALTDRQEAAQAVPWRVSDAPERFVDAQLRGIVGVEIPATRLAGKWKASQNRAEPDRRGVIAGLGAHPLAAVMDAMTGDMTGRGAQPHPPAPGGMTTEKPADPAERDPCRIG